VIAYVVPSLVLLAVLAGWWLERQFRLPWRDQALWVAIGLFFVAFAIVAPWLYLAISVAFGVVVLAWQAWTDRRR
jgi:hypothetical protein